jgi:GT2 family glycosyltransferase
MDGVEWPKVFIIVLNWNGWEDTIECLESLYDISYPNYDIIVVDNDSHDDSLAKIREYARGKLAVESASALDKCGIEPLIITNYTRREAEEKRLTTLSKKLAGESRNKAPNASIVIIQNEQNFGYPEGNNIGMRYALKASANYVLLLNNDTVVDKYFLTELIRAAEKDASIGVIGPKIYWYDFPNVIQSTGARFNFWAGWPISLNRLLRVDYMPGACFLIKRKVIEEVGKLDPTYFLYGEELDWCMRISRAGYKIVCDVNSKIWHKKLASTSKAKRFSEYYPHRNSVINMRKYARVPQFVSFLLLYPAMSIVVLLGERRFGDILYFVRGFIEGLVTPISSQPAFCDRESA